VVRCGGVSSISIVCEIVMLQLVDAYCKPLLLYGSEVYWRGGGKSYDTALRRA